MDWIWTGWSDVTIAVGRAIIAFGAVVIFSRLIGLRSYSKMSSTDFIATLAMGSGIGAAVMSLDMSLIAALFALLVLYSLQWLSAYLERFSSLEQLLNNRPVLLMAGGELLMDNISRANCTPTDIYAKLREANVFRLNQVFAVIFETTGDISILRSNDETFHYDPEIFEGVAGFEQLEDKGIRSHR